jgi:lysophospholipid acyltransferase (LPLAT)-like uncharacterized protein
LSIKNIYKSLKFEISFILIDFFYRIYTSTFRFRFTGVEHFENVRQSHPFGSFVMAVWHQGFFGSIRGMKDTGLTCLISPSKDGEIIARIASKLGYEVIRGSSSRGAAEAREDFYTRMKTVKCCPTMTVDGPRGPRFVVKSGAVDFARKGGLKILPFAMDSGKRWILSRSWDLGIIPKPFSLVRLEFAPPQKVSADCHGEDFLKAKLELAESLNQLRKKLATELQHEDLSSLSQPKKNPSDHSGPVHGTR